MTEIKNYQEFMSNIKDGIVVADFYADWCSPCKLMMPTLQKLSDELKDVKILKINVETCFNVSNSYNISSVPSIIIFKDGNVVEQLSGVKDYQKVKSAILQAG